MDRWLGGWVVGWLGGWVVGWLDGWMVGWSAAWLLDCLLFCLLGGLAAALHCCLVGGKLVACLVAW